MPAPPDAGAPAPSPEQLFGEWLARREAGVEADFADLCRAHPGAAERLRDLQRNHDELERLRRRFGLSGTIAERLASRYGSQVDPRVELEREGECETDFATRLLDRLSGRASPSSRYRLKGEVASGGMGAILRVWDEDLRRHLAMKVMLGRGRPSTTEKTPTEERRTLARFLEEAQVTGQLDHPGIVPVHELGLDAEGRVYFTMKLVKGRDLKTILELSRGEAEGWSQVKALGVLLKVCEAMRYAHDKGVIHRDLKPANVMVGRYGEVYVMDWGLARILGREDGKDIRVRAEARGDLSEIWSDRKESAGETPDSPLYTMDGDVVGTPAYMPPEQAAGSIEAVGPRADVYAVGAMLYHLLTGHMPYVRAGERASNHAVLRRVKDGPPEPLVVEAPRASVELSAICDKAMARDAGQRYRDMAALADDLSAYLESRVVAAYETGTWAETKKWVQRNRGLASSLAAALVILVAGVVTSLLYAGEAREQGKRADGKALESLGLAAAEADARRDAQEKAAEATRLKDDALARERELRVRGLIQDLAAFESLDDSLDDARRQDRPAYLWWPERARVLIEGQAEDALRGQPWRPGLADAEEQLAKLRSHALAPEPGETREGARRTWRFEHSEDEWWHAQLSRLVDELRRLPERLALAERSTSSPEAAGRWDEAIAAIRSSARYGGLRITPQVGLLPLGPDPASGLWEFAHPQSGEAAVRGSDGKLALEPETGLVFVLLPGGRSWMGAQGGDPGAKNYDVLAESHESPVHEVELSPFFVSKLEMTVGQWTRVARWTSPYWAAGDDLKPVTAVSWDDCVETLSRLDAWLGLPTEAQWEYACRAGTTTPWWTGAEQESLRDRENVRLEESNTSSARSVGELAPNPFGLYDIGGNTWEWCLELWDAGFYARSPYLDPVAAREGSGHRAIRGGSHWGDARDARSARRLGLDPVNRRDAYGLRPARALTP